MLQKDALRDLLSQKVLNKTEKLLVCLAVDQASAKAVKEIKELAVSNGLRAAKNWNVSQLLKSATTGAAALAVRTDAGWELTGPGRQFVAKLAGPLLNSPIPLVASSLRAHLVKITNADSQAFVEESIGCFESRHYRGSVVLSWVGAVSVLYDHVVKHQLGAFNAEAVARSASRKDPWKPAKTADDLARMQESEFLIILEKLSVIGKSVKRELEKCLDLRNGCGHPNSLKLADHVVSSHVEILLLNVFAKF